MFRLKREKKEGSLKEFMGAVVGQKGKENIFLKLLNLFFWFLKIMDLMRLEVKAQFGNFKSHTQRSINLSHTQRSIYLSHTQWSIYLSHTLRSIYLSHTLRSIYLSHTLRSIYLSHTLRSIYLFHTLRSIDISEICYLLNLRLENVAKPIGLWFYRF